MLQKVEVISSKHLSRPIMISFDNFITKSRPSQRGQASSDIISWEGVAKEGTIIWGNHSEVLGPKFLPTRHQNCWLPTLRRYLFKRQSPYSVKRGETRSLLGQSTVGHAPPCGGLGDSRSKPMPPQRLPTSGSLPRRPSTFQGSVLPCPAARLIRAKNITTRM